MGSSAHIYQVGKALVQVESPSDRGVLVQGPKTNRRQGGCALLWLVSALLYFILTLLTELHAVPCFQRIMNEPLYSSVTAQSEGSSVSLRKQRAFIYWCSAGDRSRGHIWCCHEIRGEENSIIAITLRKLSKIDQQ